MAGGGHRCWAVAGQPHILACVAAFPGRVPCWILMGPGEVWGKPYGSNRWQAQALPAELVSSRELPTSVMGNQDWGGGRGLHDSCTFLPLDLGSLALLCVLNTFLPKISHVVLIFLTEALSGKPADPGRDAPSPLFREHNPAVLSNGL